MLVFSTDLVVLLMMGLLMKNQTAQEVHNCSEHQAAGPVLDYIGTGCRVTCSYSLEISLAPDCGPLSWWHLGAWVLGLDGPFCESAPP